MLAEMKSDQEIVGWRWWYCGWPYNKEPQLRSIYAHQYNDWQPRRMPEAAIHQGEELLWCNLCGVDLTTQNKCPGCWWPYGDVLFTEVALDLRDKHRAARGVGCYLVGREMVGYHAFRSPQSFRLAAHDRDLNVYPPEVVMGAVSLWGTVRVYKEGYRAQYAYPRTLYVADDFPEMRTALSQAYGVEAYPRSALPFEVLSPKESWLVDRLNQPPS